MPLFFLLFIIIFVMETLSQNVYDEVLQVWVGNTEHDDFNVGCELFYWDFPNNAVKPFFNYGE